MRNFVLSGCCSLLCLCCIAQPSNSEDSIKGPTASIKKAKDDPAITPVLNIFPNPATNKITMQVKNFSPGMVSVKILDAKGKIMREDNRLLTNGSEDVVMFLSLKAGIYIILVSDQGKSARRKLLVQ